MKIRSVRHNNRKRVFEVGTSTKTLVFPFSKAAPIPTTEDPVTRLAVDGEAGREAFTYVLHSGRTGTVHVEQVLEYNPLGTLGDHHRPASPCSGVMAAAGIPMAESVPTTCRLYSGAAWAPRARSPSTLTPASRRSCIFA